MKSKALTLKIGLSSLCFGVALYLFVSRYLPSTYIDAWTPNLLIPLLVWWGVGFALPLRRGQSLNDEEIAHWFFSSFYLGLALMAAFLVWGNLLQSYHHYALYERFYEIRLYKVDLWSAPHWLVLLLALLLIQALRLFFQGDWGRRLCQMRGFQAGSFSLMIGLLLIVALELFLRSPYAIRELVGPFPIHLAPEYVDFRQDSGSEDMPFALPKAPDTKRILFMGDSYTYGWGVFEADRFANVVQALAGEEAEVVTSAIGGLSTAHELERWRRHGIGVQADIVVIGVVANDPDMALIPQASAVRPAYFKLHQLFPTSSLALYLDTRNWFARPGQNAGLLYDDWQDALYTDPATQEQWVAVVQSLHDEIRASGAEAWAYILATPTDTDAGKFARLEEVFSGAGFRTYNFFPAIQREIVATSPKQYCAFPNDCHPNAEIHAYYAKKMWADLKPVLRAN